MTMNSPDPWRSMKQPAPDSISLRKVSGFDGADDVSVAWSFTHDRKVGLFIEYPNESIDEILPNLKVIEINKGFDSAQGRKFISLRLVDDDLREIFFRLCEEVIDAVSNAGKTTVCRNVRLRLEKWQYLLRGRGKRLTVFEQQGLVAELDFLFECLSIGASPYSSVCAWTGPLRAPRDFTFGSCFVEVKSNRGSQSPVVKISSEFQLNCASDEKLFLHVVSLSESPECKGMTLDEYVERVRQLLGNDYTAKEEFERRLAAYGYSPLDEYGNRRWETTGVASYEVADGFPRILSSQLDAGVSCVQYDLDLDRCAEFVVPSEVVYSVIELKKDGK